MISPEVLTQFDLALLHVGGGFQDAVDPDTEESGGDDAKKTFWKSRAEYHHEHYPEFVRLFTAFHVAIARHRSGLIPEGPRQCPAFGNSFCVGTWHVEWECPHKDCIDRSPSPFRDADRTQVADHIAVHVGDVALEPRRLVLSGPGAAPAAFKNAASAATQAHAAASSRRSLEVSKSSGRGGKVAPSRTSSIIPPKAAPRDNLVRDQGGNTASGSAAPSKVAPAAPQVAANDKDKDKAEKKRDRTASTKELNANDDKQKAEKALRRAARAADAKAAADKEDAERFMTRPDVRPAGECTFYKEQCVSALTPCLFCDICRHTYHHACSAARNNHDGGKCPCTIGVSPT